MPLKSLQRVMSGEVKSVTLDAVDAYCCNMGRHIRDVYPHLYRPRQIEADLAMRAALDACSHMGTSHRSYYRTLDKAYTEALEEYRAA